VKARRQARNPKNIGSRAWLGLICINDRENANMLAISIYAWDWIFRAMADRTNLPNAFLSIFTAAELRAIRVIFATISAEGRCTKRLDEIAALADASRSTVRNSIAEGVRFGLLEKQERRYSGAVSEPNVITAAATTPFL
jgi:hypothetical protein